MMINPTCGYCKRTFTYRADETHFPGGRFEPDKESIPCCDDCYDEDTGKGGPLTSVTFSAEQAIAIWKTLRLRAAAASDAANAALTDEGHAPDVRFLENLKALRESLDIMRALEPGLPVSLGGTRIKWTMRELGHLKGILEEAGRGRYWLARDDETAAGAQA